MQLSDMQATADLIKKLRGLRQGSALKVNGTTYIAVDIQVLPEAEFELKEDKETKEEGLEIYLAQEGKEIGDPPFLSADFKLTFMDFMVEYNAVEKLDGIHDMKMKYDHNHMISHDFEHGKTVVYSSSYTAKRPEDVEIKLLDIEQEEIPLESLEF